MVQNVTSEPPSLSCVRCPACDAGGQGAMSPYNGFAMARCPQCSLVYTAHDEIYSSMSAYQGMIESAQQTAAGEIGYRDLWWYKRMALR